MSDSFPSLGQSSRAFPLPSIPEDAIQYVLHQPASGSEADDIALAVLITDYVYSLLTQPWLWNKDPWELKAVGGEKLEGRMRVGDAVDDEWCVVWLLREVSKRWPELVMSIRDTDGEFLLIEAANELPSWVTPDNANNRLWVQGGHLHLIPLSVQSNETLSGVILDEDESLGLTEAAGVAAVRTGKYRADAVEEAVWRRIASYPKALKTHQHRANAYLPIPVAKALSVQPELIQKAVEGFYVRDPAQLRAASRMTHFPPSTAILNSVLMTRTAYAQLQGQVFHPPRVFGPEWHVREGDELDDERRWRDIGVKIATGFEIMYREGGKRGRSGSTTKPEDTPEYQKYLSDLQKAGFFGNELQGSAKWKEREKEASKGWTAARSEDVTSQRSSFAFEVDQAVTKAPEPTPSTLLEDSRSWLEVSPNDLDGMLAGIGGPASGKETKVEVGDEDGKALGDLAKKVQDFVGGQGDEQGARFADELSDEDFDIESDEEDESPGLAVAEKEERLRSLVPPLPEGEWGQKTDLTTKKRSIEDTAHQIDETTAARTSRFARQEYDGVESDSDDSNDDLPPEGTIGRRIAQMKWSDGAKLEDLEQAARKENSRRKGLGDDIDVEMERRVFAAQDQDDEPQIVELDDDEEEGAGDLDMTGEGDEFLRFAKDALGMTDEQYEGVLKSRRDRGAFVPNSSALPEDSTSKTSKPVKVSKAAAIIEPSSDGPSAPSGPDMSLSSFEKVMQAMDAQLAQSKGLSPTASKPLSTLHDLPADEDLDDLDDSDLEAMDRELKAALKGAGVDEMDGIDEDDPDEVGELGEDQRREYQMMKDFLESYRSQAGQSGVVGNLFGRLGAGGAGSGRGV